jgi:hypothetical protein
MSGGYSGVALLMSKEVEGCFKFKEELSGIQVEEAVKMFGLKTKLSLRLDY